MSSPSFDGKDYDEFLASGAPKPYTYTLKGISYPIDIVFEAGTWKFITDNTDLRTKIADASSAFKGNSTICIPDSPTAAKGLNPDQKRTRCIDNINKKIKTLGLTLGHPDPSSAFAAASSSATSSATPSTAPSAATSSAAPSTAPSATAAAVPPAVTPDPSGAVFKDVTFLDKTYSRVNQVATEGILYTSQKDLVDALFIGHMVTTQPTRFKDILQAIIDGECATDMPIITKTTCKPVRQWIRELMKLYLENMDTMDKTAVAAAAAAASGTSGASGTPVASGADPSASGGIPGGIPGADPGTKPADPGASRFDPGISGGIPVVATSTVVPSFVPDADPVVPSFVPGSSSSSSSGSGGISSRSGPPGAKSTVPLVPTAAAAIEKEALEADAAFAAAEAEVATLLAKQAEARKAADDSKNALTWPLSQVVTTKTVMDKAIAAAKAATKKYNADPSSINNIQMIAAKKKETEARAAFEDATKKHVVAEALYNKAKSDLTTISESVKEAQATAVKAKANTSSAKVALITKYVKDAKDNIQVLLNDSKNISTINDMIKRGDDLRNLSAIINVKKLEENIKNATAAADAAVNAAEEATAAAVTPEAKVAAQEATLAAAAVKSAAIMASTAITAITAMVNALSQVDKADPSDVKTITEAVKTNITNVMKAMKDLADAMTAKAVKVPAPPQKRITITIDIPKEKLDKYLSESKSSI